MMDNANLPNGDDTSAKPPGIDRLTTVFIGGALVLAGMFVIMIMALVEQGAAPVDEWTDAIVAIEGPPLWEDNIYSAWFHRFDHTELPGESRLIAALEDTPGGADAIRGLGLDHHETFVAAELPPEAWDQLLAEGRPPAPGEPEVLAGDLARYDSFDFLGDSWRGTGKIRPEGGPFVVSYVAPVESVSDPSEADFTEGWIAPAGLQRLDERDHDIEDIKAEPLLETEADAEDEEPDAEEEDEDEEERRVFLQGNARTPVGIVWGVILGLILTAIGGTILQVQLIQRLAERRVPVVGVFLSEAARRPGLLWGMHGFHYALFFAPMLFALLNPLTNLRLMTVVQATFTEGELAYVGAAYLSGNILHAAAATFVHNYLYATVLMAILPSLIIPFWGVFKNVISFSVVGFAMAPLWQGTAAPYTYHSLTMVLELQAYMVAAVAVCFLPMAIVDGIRRGRPGSGIGRGLHLIAGGTVFVGIQLAIAALYEAFTLIQFGGAGS